MHETALNTASIRPLIIDRHDATRLGHALLLRRQPWVGRCLMARDVTEACALAARHRPEVALLDISDAGPFVASATAALTDAHRPLRIVLTSRCASRLSGSPHRLGAVGFVAPGATHQEVLSAVRAAVLGISALSPDRIRAERPQLRERDRRLLELISTGATNREIAVALHVSPETVKKNASRLYRELDVRNRTEAARRAREVLAAGLPS